MMMMMPRCSNFYYFFLRVSVCDAFDGLLGSKKFKKCVCLVCEASFWF